MVELYFTYLGLHHSGISKDNQTAPICKHVFFISVVASKSVQDDRKSDKHERKKTNVKEKRKRESEDKVHM